MDKTCKNCHWYSQDRDPRFRCINLERDGWDGGVGETDTCPEFVTTEDFKPDLALSALVGAVAKAMNRQGVCSHCGSPRLQPNGACQVCPDCGETTGCS